MRKLLCAVTLALIVVFLPVLTPATSNAAGSPTAATLIALRQVGDSYVHGAEGPRAFDCSGLVQYSFRRAGYRNVPRTSQGQYNRSRKISRSNTRRGDLLFYHNRSGRVFHVAIYLGRGRVVEAANPRAGVRTARVWQAPHRNGRMRR